MSPSWTLKMPKASPSRCSVRASSPAISTPLTSRGGWVNLTKNETTADATCAGSGSINRAYEVPCRKEMTKDVVPLEVSGKTIWVFIDTGAASTIFDDKTFDSLGITMPADAPVVRGSGVGGQLSLRQVELDLRLGPINRLG